MDELRDTGVLLLLLTEDVEREVDCRLLREDELLETELLRVALVFVLPLRTVDVVPVDRLTVADDADLLAVPDVRPACVVVAERVVVVAVVAVLRFEAVPTERLLCPELVASARRDTEVLWAVERLPVVAPLTRVVPAP